MANLTCTPDGVLVFVLIYCLTPFVCGWSNGSTLVSYPCPAIINGTLSRYGEAHSNPLIAVNTLVSVTNGMPTPIRLQHGGRSADVLPRR